MYKYIYITHEINLIYIEIVLQSRSATKTFCSLGIGTKSLEVK